MDMKNELNTEIDLLFTDPDTEEKWYLNEEQINYLEKWVGFCPTCEESYTSRWEISIPRNKLFLGTRCISYWKSINKNNPRNIKIECCGHDESKGWISVYDIYK
jgi:hypothetical protein